MSDLNRVGWIVIKGKVMFKDQNKNIEDSKYDKNIEILLLQLRSL